MRRDADDAEFPVRISGYVDRSLESRAKISEASASLRLCAGFSGNFLLRLCRLGGKFIAREHAREARGKVAPADRLSAAPTRAARTSRGGGGGGGGRPPP